MSPYFQGIEDSPLWRAKADEIEATAEPLEKRCQRFLKGSKRYQEGLSHFAECQTAFATALEEFCGTDDEEGMVYGAPMMSKFVGIFKELSAYTDFLHTQVDVHLCQLLQQTWIKVCSLSDMEVQGVLAHVKESQKQLDRKTSEYDSARLKHLGHNKVNTKWSAPEKAHADMILAEESAESARFEATRALTELQGRKRIDFLEGVMSVINSHLRFFEGGTELLKRLEPLMENATEVVGNLKKEQSDRMASLEQSIATYCRSKLEADFSPKAPSPAEYARGPLQLTSNMGKLTEEFEGYIRKTAESNGSHVTVLKQGYLNKRSSNLRKGWKRRFFVLDSLGMLYYYSGKERVDRRKTPQNTVSLVTSTVKPGVDESEGGRPLKFCFRVVSTEKTYLLQAESDSNMRSWVTALQGVIATLLSGAIDLTDISSLAQSKPSKPTHSRHGSLSGPEDAAAGPSTSSVRATRTASGPADVFLPFIGSAPPAASGAVLATPEPSERANLQAISQVGVAQSPTGNSPGTSPQRQGGSQYVINVLRQADGNSRCADCNAPDPDWASLNLGVLVCIQCSGIHRQLGVHVSKVRSLTLDVKVWEGPALPMMAGLGNAAANEVWEEALRTINARSDSWVWNDDSDDESSPSRPSGLPEGQSPTAEGDLHYLKPSAQHSISAKEQFITAKYSERRFVVNLPQEVLQRNLWNAVANQDLRPVMRAVARGADVNAITKSRHSDELLEYFEQHCGGSSESFSPLGRQYQGLPVLFLACKLGSLSIAEFLLQNRAAWDSIDAGGRTPLHYAVACDHPDIALALLHRGADRQARDAAARTPLDLAIAKGSLPNTELFAMLSSEGPLVPMGQ